MGVSNRDGMNASEKISPVCPLMKLSKDICQHKLCEVSALLHMRQREVSQKVVQKLNEADDLVIDLCASLLTDTCVTALPYRMFCVLCAKSS